jgi:hypothetical protein
MDGFRVNQELLHQEVEGDWEIRLANQADKDAARSAHTYHTGCTPRLRGILTDGL